MPILEHGLRWAFPRGFTGVQVYLQRVLTRRAALGVFSLVVVITAPSMRRVTVDDDYVALLPTNNSSAAFYRDYLASFPHDAGTVVIVSGPNLCTLAGWHALVRLTASLEGLDDVERVAGLTTAKYVAGQGNEVSVAEFGPLDGTSEPSFCSAALRYPPYRGVFITEDGGAVALYVVPSGNVDAVQMSRQIEDILEGHRAAFDEDSRVDADTHTIAATTNLFQSGELYMSAAISAATKRAALIYPVVIILMLFLGAYQARSFKVGCVVAATGVCAAYFTVGLMGYMGIPQNPVNALVINLLIPLGSAFAIHAENYLRDELPPSSGWLPLRALRPFAFATVTTMVGFGATAISGIPAVRQFGLFGAFGIAMCLFTTLTLTFPLLTSQRRDAVSRLEIRPRLILRRWHTIAIVAVLSLVSIVGIGFLHVEHGPVDYLTTRTPAHKSFDRASALFGAYTMPLVVLSEEPGAAIEPSLQQRVRDFVTTQAKEMPGLKVASLYGQLSQLSLAFTADETIPSTFPATADAVSQFLLLLAEHDIEPYLDHERQHLAVFVQTPFQDTTGFQRLDSAVSGFAERHGLHMALTGRTVQFFRAALLIAEENVRSLLIGLLLVWVCFAVLLRSTRLAFIVLIPNALPVLGSLAFLGIFGINLDVGTSIVAAVALGLVVDDTGHLVVRYTGYRRQGRGPEAAATLAVADVATPIVMTTVTVVVGFAAMNLADLVPFHTFSRLLSFVIAYGVVADLILLPSLLTHFDRPS